MRVRRGDCYKKDIRVRNTHLETNLASGPGSISLRNFWALMSISLFFRLDSSRSIPKGSSNSPIVLVRTGKESAFSQMTNRVVSVSEMQIGELRKQNDSVVVSSQCLFGRKLWGNMLQVDGG